MGAFFVCTDVMVQKFFNAFLPSPSRVIQSKRMCNVFCTLVFSLSEENFHTAQLGNSSLEELHQHSHVTFFAEKTLVQTKALLLKTGTIFFNDFC